MNESAKSVEELMADLRRDVEAWKARLGDLKTEEQYAEIVRKIEAWMKQADGVLARWSA